MRMLYVLATMADKSIHPTWDCGFPKAPKLGILGASTDRSTNSAYGTSHASNKWQHGPKRQMDGTHGGSVGVDVRRVRNGPLSAHRHTCFTRPFRIKD